MTLTRKQFQFVLDNASDHTLKQIRVLSEAMEKKFPELGSNVNYLMATLFLDGWEACRKEVVESMKKYQKTPWHYRFDEVPE